MELVRDRQLVTTDIYVGTQSGRAINVAVHTCHVKQYVNVM
jgi:hypothetical protein